jgi:hypothetical protein
MLFDYLRQLRISRQAPAIKNDNRGEAPVSPFKEKLNAMFQKYEKRISYHHKKITLILFCVISFVFFTWLLTISLGRRYPFHPSAGVSNIVPVPPILSDTHSLPLLWRQLPIYSDSIHHQPLHHDTIKNQ